MEGTTCPLCGTIVEAGVARCPTCGAAIKSPPPGEPPATTGGMALDADQTEAIQPVSPAADERPPATASAFTVAPKPQTDAASAAAPFETPLPADAPPAESGETAHSEAAPGAAASEAAPAPGGAESRPSTAAAPASATSADKPYPPYPGASAYPPYPGYPAYPAPAPGPYPAYAPPDTATPYVAPGYRYPGWNYATGAAPAAPPTWPVPPAPAQPPVAPASAQPAQASRPGYPAYPQGNPAFPPAAAPGYGYPPYGYPGYGFPGYGFPGYGYPPAWVYYPAYVPVLVRRRHPSDTHALVISWIVTSAGGLSLLCGLLVTLLLLYSAANGGVSDSLSTETTFFDFIVAPLLGGTLALSFGIRGILRRPSPRFALPHPALFGGLAAAVFTTAIILWHVNAAPGPGLANLPLVVLSGALPAFTILSFAAWRLRMPTSRRHVWMSLIYGSTLGALTALILNTIGEVVVVLFLLSIQRNAGGAQDPLNPSRFTTETIIAAFVILSVMAPLVEEGVKPLGAVLLMRRLATPASAFLTGLAAGIGFDLFETLLYIGQGQADWVTVAIGRLGAGLLHGVGAGMGALGWYYFINGKGVPRRWWRGIGCLAYAVLQHGIFNGTTLVLAILPGDVGRWLQEPLFIGRLGLDRATLIIFVYYAIIVWVLVKVTGRLRRSTTKREIAPLPQRPGIGAPPAAPATTDLQPLGSAAR